MMLFKDGERKRLQFQTILTHPFFTAMHIEQWVGVQKYRTTSKQTDSHTPLLFFFHKYTRYYLLPSTPDQVSELATFYSQECPAQVQPIDRLGEISRFSLNAGERQNENTFSWAATKSRKLPVWKKVINIFSFLTFSTDKV